MLAPFRVDAMRVADVPVVANIAGATPMDEAHLRQELARPWSRLWVARETDELPIAFLIAWHVADELHVLIDEAVAYARTRGIRHVLLEVRRSNRAAIALYRTVGFFAMGLRVRYYPDNEDAVEMVLMLDPDTGSVVAHPDEVRLDP
jgi:[ribosomal protein S18]-alanine N-acetyltransferase